MLHVGDTVKLKSGGPIMVITRLGYQCAEVSWFDDRNEEHYGTFPIACLTPRQAKSVSAESR